MFVFFLFFFLPQTFFLVSPHLRGLGSTESVGLVSDDIWSSSRSRPVGQASLASCLCSGSLPLACDQKYIYCPRFQEERADCREPPSFLPVKYLLDDYLL